MTDQMMFHYHGVSVHQNANVVAPFRALLADLRPARVIEIGTAAGGLTLIIRDLMDNLGLDGKLFTFDPMPMDRPYLARPGIVYTQADALAGDDVEYLVDVTDGPCLVLCDGGNKAREFQRLAPVLRPGDVLMAHDYAPSRAYFDEVMDGVHWNWLEITDEDIMTPCFAYGLVPYQQEVFQRVAWACRRKA